MRTGTCITLIVVGSILRFAIAGGSYHGVNVHVVGVIVLLAGVLGLLLSLLLLWRPLNPGQRRRDRGLAFDGGPLPVIGERRMHQAHPPIVEERRLGRAAAVRPAGGCPPRRFDSRLPAGPPLT
jgi:hypothetical protein